MLSTEAQSYLARHKQLVQAVLHAGGRIGLSDQVTDGSALETASTHCPQTADCQFVADCC